MGVLASNPEDLPDPKLLHDRYHYDPETGDLHKKDKHFKFIDGKPHGNKVTSKNKYGYIKTTFLYRTLLAHRVIWAIFYGEWPPPDKHIDHINRVRTDNRLKNLRLVDMKDNNNNRTLPKKSKRGIKFGKNLKKYLNKHKMMQKDLAEILGIDVNSIFNWVHGKQIAKESTIDKIEQRLGINLSK